MMYRHIKFILCLVWLCYAPSLYAAPSYKPYENSQEPTGRWELEQTGEAALPPMGWNSWNAFGTDLNEEKVRGAAQTILDTGLASLGYRYINLDDGWWHKRRTTDGRLQIRTSLFPSSAIGGAAQTSFKPFTDDLHAMGLKAGIYSDIGRNACSQAYTLDSPNLPEGTIEEREVGLYGHLDQDMSLFFQEWGFDYIKVDGCGISAYGLQNPNVRSHLYREFTPIVSDQNVYQSDVVAVKKLYGALRSKLMSLKADNHFILSLCTWGTANVRSWGKDFGSLYRTSNDIEATWSRMLHAFDSVVTRELYASPYHWNDPDMLEIGHGDFDTHHLTEAKSHFSLWAIVAAPLMIGYDLRNPPQSLLNIWGNPEVIAINQDPLGNQASLAFNSHVIQILVKSLSQRDEKAVALFNRSSEPVTVQLTADHLKMSDTHPIYVRNLWERKDNGQFVKEQSFTLQGHETILLKVKGTPHLDKAVYLSEIPGRINVAADGITAFEADPSIFRMTDPYKPTTRSDGMRPLYAGWGGPRIDSTPYDETLRIAGHSFRTGIGLLAGSRLQIKNEGSYRQFNALVGLDDSSRGKNSPVIFEVYGDGKLLARTKLIGYNDKEMTITADVSQAKVIELVVRQKKNTQGPVIAVWGEANLTLL
jgi:hypothetical protein